MRYPLKKQQKKQLQYISCCPQVNCRVYREPKPRKFSEPQKRRLLSLAKSAEGNLLNSESCKKEGPGCTCYFLSYILPSPLSCHCSVRLRGLIRALLRKALWPRKVPVVHAVGLTYNQVVKSLSFLCKPRLLLRVKWIQEEVHYCFSFWVWSIDSM